MMNLRWDRNELIICIALLLSVTSKGLALRAPAPRSNRNVVSSSLLSSPETINGVNDLESEGLQHHHQDVDIHTTVSATQKIVTACASRVNGAVEGTSAEQGHINTHSKKMKGKRRRNQKKNTASGDTAFLRKRTALLLRITSNGYERNCSNPILGRKMKVDRKTFNWLIDSWSFSGEIDAADKAIALLVRMEKLDEAADKETTFRPDVRTYTKVINAISRSGREDAGEVAEKILNRMEGLFSSARNIAAKPNTFSYTALIEAHANSGAPGSAVRAAELCGIMAQKWEQGDPDVKPTSRSYNAAIKANRFAPDDAEALFHHMVENYQAGNLECKPNAYNYNALISAIANSGSALRAAQVLAQMEAENRSGLDETKPTTISFNTVIDAYAKSGEENAAEKAEDVLRHMDELYRSGENMEAKPNVRSFNSVINAYAKSGRADAAPKAERALELMEMLYETGNEDVRPDVHSFCTVINAWAKSQTKDKAERAERVFRQMKRLHEAGNTQLRPNVVAYNAVLNACAFTHGSVSDSNRALAIAQWILKELESSKFATADQVTYGTFFKVCDNQMAKCEARDRVLKVIFRKCCEDGMVGKLVLKQLRLATEPETFAALTGRESWDDAAYCAFLPQEWRCNVVEGKWHRQRWRDGFQACNSQCQVD